MKKGELEEEGDPVHSERLEKKRWMRERQGLIMMSEEHRPQQAEPELES